MKRFLMFMLSACVASAFAQRVTINPTVTPALFRYNDQITVTYDATGTSLANLTDAYIWIWIPGKSIDAKYNINPATTATSNAKFNKTGSTFSITFKPSDFFTSSISTETTLGMLIKGTDWSKGQSSDYLTTFWDGSFTLKLTSPANTPVFVDTNDVIQINAEAPVAANFQLYVNNVATNSQGNTKNYSYAHTVTESSGYSTIRLTAIAMTGGSPTEITFQYILSGPSPNVPRPSGIIAGINYHAGDATKATLCLWAPGKTSAYVLGDISDWAVLPQNLMNKDGEYFWIELSGLTAGQEYGYQYLVDETLTMADAFADKILDPDDQYIPATTYPNLKTYPIKALSADWYKNRVAVLQTDQTAYAWQKLDFQRPKKESLVIYELLLRDYFASGKRNYQTLIDTIPYLKRLGVNAIELMPIMEFNGNESWGYNPAFMFAPDKAYGTKDKFKEFIDQCHINGIAVILDIAMNHQDLPNPFVMLDFNFNTYQPTANNKWFNVTARHPFSVFYDMNHESAYTKKYLDTVNYHWLNEYKVDGFRFDLSKGFTQTNNPTDVGAWSNYDASRIAILKRMADKIWTNFPTAYVILEHLAVNAEEKELAEYKAFEGKGMMLWGNLNYQYNQNTMGFADNSDISGVYHGSRSWSVPNLVGYMESHDEERLMYRNIQFGNTSGNYSTKNISTALPRMKAAALMFFTIPGPKMLWEFGELGYDQSINLCGDGTISNDCRLSIKPAKWEYLEEYSRYNLFEQYADLIRLKKGVSAFQDGTVIFSTNGLVKQAIIKNKLYTTTPVDSTRLSAVVVANFEMQTQDVVVNFPHAGTWYNYYSGESINITGTSSSMTFAAGGFKMFTNFQLTYPVVTSVSTQEVLYVYPNPASDFLKMDRPDAKDLTLYSVTGSRIKPDKIGDVWDVRTVPSGLYIGSAQTTDGVYRFKIIIRR